MTRYTGNHCPVCEQAFTDEDDIVVCPDCGTPYHRACWQKVGACMHKSEHAAGFEWQPEFGPDAEKPRTRPPARTAAPTTSRARRSAATAAVPCRRTTDPDPTRRTRTRRCRSTPATRPPCISRQQPHGPRPPHRHLHRRRQRRHLPPRDRPRGYHRRHQGQGLGRLRGPQPDVLPDAVFPHEHHEAEGHSLPVGIPVRACLSALPQDVEGGSADSPAVPRFERAVAHRHCGDLQPVAVRQYAAALGARGRRRLCHCGLDRQDFAGAFLGLAVPQHLKEKY